MSCFRYVFRICKPEGGFYNWEDQQYRDFMFGILQKMEPRCEEKGNILYKELEEIQELLFHQSGIIDIGYEISRKARYVLRMHSGTIIGGYNCTENKKTVFQYKCTTDVHGFMLRKEHWLNLLEEYP